MFYFNVVLLIGIFTELLEQYYYHLFVNYNLVYLLVET